jgi:hypothetical protein
MANDEQVAAAAKVMVDSDALALLLWGKMSESTRAMFYPTVRSMLDAAETAAWRPITEAPRDGKSLFDLWIVRDYYGDPLDIPRREPDCRWDPDRRFWRDCVMRDLRDQQASHFRSLPPAPVKAT